MIVETTTGPIRGTLERTSDGVDVHRFAGIPYAKPPVASLRFRAPQPVMPWSTVRDAATFGPIACQNTSSLDAMFRGEPEPRSEDCLYLNVWSSPTGSSRPSW